MEVFVLEEKEQGFVPEVELEETIPLPEESAQENVTAPEEEPIAEKKRKRRSEKDGWQGMVLMYLHDLAYLLAGLILIFILLFRVVIVEGKSMNSTLLDGDYLLLLSSTFYQEPQQGDIIVASKKSFDNGNPIVKRVIATEGQWVEIVNGVVYVGDTEDTMEPLKEDYALTPTPAGGMNGKIQVAEGCLFVMGDNRSNSTDSRSQEIGLLEKREVMGKVIFRFLPGDNEGKEKKDYGRIGVPD